MLKDTIKIYLATALLFLMAPDQSYSKTTDQNRVQFEKEFVELQMTGETRLCNTASVREVKSIAKSLALGSTFEVQKAADHCSQVSLTEKIGTPETNLNVFHDNLVALHGKGSLQLCLQDSQGKSEADKRHYLIKKLGQMARALSLGESLITNVAEEAIKLTSEEPDRVLCTSLRPVNFDGRRKSAAFESYLARPAGRLTTAASE